MEDDGERRVPKAMTAAVAASLNNMIGQKVAARDFDAYREEMEAALHYLEPEERDRVHVVVQRGGTLIKYPEGMYGSPEERFVRVVIIIVITIYGRVTLDSTP